jgi:gamma-aminobutyric acid receptor subunit beta
MKSDMNIRILIEARRIMLILLLLTFQLTSRANNESDCSIPIGLTKSRPDSDGPPTPISVGIRLINVSDINEVNQEFKIDFLVLVRWTDTRLSLESRGSSLDECTVRFSDIWHPFLDIVNQREVIAHYDDLVEIDADGSVTYLQRYSGTLASPLELKRFPFDRQTLSIQIASFSHGADELNLVIDESLTSQREGLAPVGWKILEFRTELSTENFTTADISLVKLEQVVIVERLPGYYVWNVFVPIILIVFMAWTVFWIDPNRFDAQIALSTAAALTLIAFLLSTRQLLPRVEYLTRADIVILGSAVIVFFSLGEAVITSNLASKGKEVLARATDHWSRIVYAVLFAVIMIVAVWF